MLDRIKGCLMGGAMGDALGYAVEFTLEDEIFQTYGPAGITAYDLNFAPTGEAIISDDTQMTLFTACGLLCADTAGVSSASCPPSRRFVEMAYVDWLHTQYPNQKKAGLCWLLQEPRLFSRRAPGGTCLTALSTYAQNSTTQDYIAASRNTSKGCGGVMRVAPIALQNHGDIEVLDMEAAQVSAITHGHSLGYIPSAILCHIIHRILFPTTSRDLKSLVLEALDTANKLFAGDPYLPQLNKLIKNAIKLSENTAPDLKNIHKLGEGWVAEEALAISIYCSLRYKDNFSAAIIAAANHKGDSDSTAAITGNILGALLGFEAIEDKWKQDLELKEIIETIAQDLYTSHSLRDGIWQPDAQWLEKYGTTQ